MTLALALLVLSSAGCLRFQQRIDACFADGGRCVTPPDGGPEEVFPELDGGGFRFGNDWRWESPLPFGQHLNAVYATSDLLIVAGNGGLLAERRAGRWASLQHLDDSAYRQFSGTTPDDLWLSRSDGRLMHRDGGWDSLRTGESVISVTQLDRTLFLGTAGAQAGRFENGSFVAEGTYGSTEVLVGTYANEVVVLSMEADGGRALTGLDGGPFFLLDGGPAIALAVERLYTSSNDLWLSGGQALRVAADAGRVLLPVNQGVSAASPGATTAMVALNDGLGRIDGTRVTIEQRGVGGILAFHREEASMTVWAVGEAGQIYRRAAQGNGWSAETWVPTRASIRAIVPFADTLFAFSDEGQVLRRGADRWEVIKELPNVNFVDAVSDGTQLVALDQQYRLYLLDAAGGMVGQFDVEQTSDQTAAHVWRSPGGTLVVTGGRGIYVRKPADDSYRPVSSVVPSSVVPTSGVGGRAEVIRVCSAEGVHEIDLSVESPTARLVDEKVKSCRSVLQLSDGWVYGTMKNGEASIVRKGVGNVEQETQYAGTNVPVQALVEVKGGVAAGMDGFALLRFADWPVGGGKTVVPSRVGNLLFCLRVWRGRLFAGGDNGAIVERALQ